jgi:hypothetical protein
VPQNCISKSLHCSGYEIGSFRDQVKAGSRRSKNSVRYRGTFEGRKEITNAVGFHKQRVVVTNREEPFVLLTSVEDLKKLHMLDEAAPETMVRDRSYL